MTHRQARATEIDLTARTVVLGSGAPLLAYDTLVYALGSRTAFHGVPGAVVTGLR
ncbi:hypothetical protein [Kitasatospora sp. NBC_01539]|uniref:hypothetical protein n=1 Tax=Kitasatospora sp. NBC_01539 TaxID=2903577 RepID=UPI00386019A2